MIPIKWFSLCVALALPGAATALEDPGKAKIGLISVTVYHATDGDAKTTGLKTSKVPKDTEDRLRGEKCLRFKHYGLLGGDTQPLLRSYESWAQPLKPSEEVLVRFEARARPTKKSTMLDLELWLARKKIVKTDARLEGRRPLYFLGPEYRGGRLIIAVALASEPKPSP
jgi:hypothetical protein